MQDQYVILTQGFKNVRRGAETTGFQFAVRIPYYRGVYLSAVDSLSARIDGREIAPDKLTITLGKRTFTLAQMVEAADVRWFYREPAILTVSQSGGLAPGLHEVEVGIAIRKSYFPSTDPEHLYDFFGLWKDGKYTPYLEAPTVVRKKMTLVQ